MNEDKVKAELSKAIAVIAGAGFGYITPVLRTALFSASSQIDWAEVENEMKKQLWDLQHDS